MASQLGYKVRLLPLYERDLHCQLAADSLKTRLYVVDFSLKNDDRLLMPADVR